MVILVKSRRKENKKIVMRYYETLLGKGRKMEKVRAFGSVNSFTLIGPWILQNPDELFLLSRNTACTLRQLALLSLTSKWTQINTNFFFSFSLFCSFSFYIFSFSFFFPFSLSLGPVHQLNSFPLRVDYKKEIYLALGWRRSIRTRRFYRVLHTQRFQIFIVISCYLKRILSACICEFVVT